jgi:DNA-directed RNA polymerase specialized sigma54-like protein
LVEALGESGVHIARRTVTKYRKALGIESSSRRRQF